MLSESTLQKVIDMLNAAAKAGQYVVAPEMRCVRCDQHVPNNESVLLQDGDGWAMRMCEACWLEVDRVEA